MKEQKFGFSLMYLTTKKIVPVNILSFIEDKIRLFIKDKNLEKIISKEWCMLIGIVPNDDAEEVKFLEPSRNRHEKFINYAIHFPAKSIAKSTNPNETFMKLFFEAINPFLKEKLSISEDELTQIQKEVEEKFFNDTTGWRIE